MAQDSAGPSGNLDLPDISLAEPTATTAMDNPPTALCKNATVALDATGNVSITGSTLDNGSFDDMGPVTLSLSQSTFDCTLASLVPNNSTQVTLTVTDNIGQMSNCVATLTVIDNQFPVFVDCPPNLTFHNEPGECGARPTWAIPTATDNCPNVPVYQAAGPFSGQFYFQVGISTFISYRAADQSGNPTNCTFTIMVKDTEAPIISCPGNIVRNSDPNNCGAVINYALPNPTDNCNFTSLAQLAGPSSGANFPLGTTSVVFRATDGALHTATCAFTVTVLDNQVPSIINCPANITQPNDPNGCGATVTYGTPMAFDNCSVQSLTRITGLPSGSFFPVGTTSVTYRATDGSGLSSTCGFTVTVNDTQPPSLICPPNAVYDNDPGLCGATKTYPLPVSMDNCALLSPPVLISGLASSSFFPVGATVNVWRVTDPSNNTATCSFTLRVNDVEKPKIACPADILRDNDFGHCHAKISNIGQPVFSDNCSVYGLSSDSHVTFPVGSVVVVWAISDIYGNTNSCTQMVTIEDREYPVITCPANMEIDTDEGDCVATVAYNAKAKDNCGLPLVQYDIEPASAFPIGLTNVTAISTDAAGNSVQCVFQVSVRPRTEICNDLDDDCDGLVDESEDWVRVAKRHASDPSGLSEYGSSVDIEGDYAVVGASKKNPAGQSVGAAYILFRHQNGPQRWGQIAQLEAPGIAVGDNFGASVAIAGGVAVVGAPSHNLSLGNEGAVFVFHQNPLDSAMWSFVKKITAATPAAGDNFGYSVALDGETLLAGATGDDESEPNAGAAYSFYRNQGGADQWGQVAKLRATTGYANDHFGASVSIDGHYAVVGADGVDGLWQDAGAAYVFGQNQFGPDNWGQVAKLEALQSGPNDHLGKSVAISGAWVLAGANQNDLKGTDAGAVFAFYKNQNGINDSWGQRHLLLDYNGKAGDRYGSAVAIDGEYAIVTAKGDDDHFGEDSGTGFVYLRQDDGWVSVGNLEDGGGKKSDALGSCAALSGRTAILGAPLDDDTFTDEGAALVFTGLCSTSRPEYRSAAVPVLDAFIQYSPNPFRTAIQISVDGLQNPHVRIDVLNLLGQTVATLHQGPINTHWDGHWAPDAAVASGVYFLRVTAPGVIHARTIVLER